MECSCILQYMYCRKYVVFKSHKTNRINIRTKSKRLNRNENRHSSEETYRHTDRVRAKKI